MSVARRSGQAKPATPWASLPSLPRVRLTQYAHGGGCACKIPPGELESLVAGLAPPETADLLIGELVPRRDCALEVR